MLVKKKREKAAVMVEWEDMRTNALDEFLNNKEMLLKMSQLNGIFNEEVGDIVVPSLGVTLGEIATAYVKRIYSSGTGKKATQKKSVMLKHVPRN